MVDHDEVAASRAVQRRTGPTFHIATRLLPRRVRRATYVLYAFFRTADEVVDDPDPPPPDEQLAELERIRAAALGERGTDDPVLSAFDAVRRRHGIDAGEVEAFLAAMAADVGTSRYETLADLDAYMRGSSVAVANMMTTVMDPDDRAAADPHAAALGEAFQLTNVVRDVREDVRQYDRVYLPRETLAAHGVDEADLRADRASPGLRRAVRELLAATEDRYREGVAGIRYLPADCRFGVLAAAVLYADHHRLVRRRDCDVLADPPSLPTARKLWLVARTGVAWLRYRDPERVFYAVSPVDRAATAAGRPRERTAGDVV